MKQNETENTGKIVINLNCASKTKKMPKSNKLIKKWWNWKYIKGKNSKEKPKINSKIVSFFVQMYRYKKVNLYHFSLYSIY